MYENFPKPFESKLADSTVDLVNARDLYEFLEVGRDFSTWIKDRIEEYGFLENQDFILSSSASAQVFPRFGENQNLGGRPTVEYHITIDMAKELAMVEKNAKGRQVRRYFIDCEKALRLTYNDIDNSLIRSHVNVLFITDYLNELMRGRPELKRYQYLMQCMKHHCENLDEIRKDDYRLRGLAFKNGYDPKKRHPDYEQ